MVTVSKWVQFCWCCNVNALKHSFNTFRIQEVSTIHFFIYFSSIFLLLSCCCFKWIFRINFLYLWYVRCTFIRKKKRWKIQSMLINVVDIHTKYNKNQQHLVSHSWQPTTTYLNLYLSLAVFQKKSVSH